MDVFIEQIVERKPLFHDRLLKTLLLLAMASLTAALLFAGIAFLSMPFISFSALAAVPGAIWLGIHFLKGLTVEYEYILTNKELDIDKIIGKRKRKRMFTFDLNNAEKLDICEEGGEFSADVTVSAHDNSYTNMWYLIIKHDSHGRVLLLFNPNDAFAVKLNNALPHRIRNSKIPQNVKEQK